jgi:hypothetical protein
MLIVWSQNNAKVAVVYLPTHCRKHFINVCHILRPGMVKQTVKQQLHLLWPAKAYRKICSMLVLMASANTITNA